MFFLFLFQLATALKLKHKASCEASWNKALSGFSKILVVFCCQQFQTQFYLRILVVPIFFTSDDRKLVCIEVQKPVKIGSFLTVSDWHVMYINRQQIENAMTPSAPSAPNMHQVAPSAQNKVLTVYKVFYIHIYHRQYSPPPTGISTMLHQVHQKYTKCLKYYFIYI